MSRKQSKEPSVNGPFAQAADRVEKLATNMYLSALCMETIEQLQKTQKAYEDALLSGDLLEAEKAKGELDFVEEIMRLTTINYNTAMREDSSKEQ